MHYFIAIFIFIICSPMAYSKSYTYCTQSTEINLNPFRKGINPNELSYLFLVTRPIISNEISEGILSKWSFSPNGKRFRAKINTDFKWKNGRVLSAKDVAYSLAKTLPYRPL